MAAYMFAAGLLIVPRGDDFSSGEGLRCGGGGNSGLTSIDRTAVCSLPTAKTLIITFGRASPTSR